MDYARCHEGLSSITWHTSMRRGKGLGSMEHWARHCEERDDIALHSDQKQRNHRQIARITDPLEWGEVNCKNVLYSMAIGQEEFCRTLQNMQISQNFQNLWIKLS